VRKSAVFAHGRLATRLPGITHHACREPQFAHAERACWWELVALASHAHPSVASFSRTLLSGQCIVYAGDPLRDLALTSFLDKFIEKKPKVGDRGRGGAGGGCSECQDEPRVSGWTEEVCEVDVAYWSCCGRVAWSNDWVFLPACSLSACSLILNAVFVGCRRTRGAPP
jgi:hypothetical protein